MNAARIVLPFVTLLLAPWTALGAGDAPARPNILFILTDDQGPWTTGVAGHAQAKTPHLDRLFRDGAYLPNSFTVTPVCSPSRASTMSGRYGSELGITDWINPRTEPDVGLDPKTVTWPRVLAQGGYATGLVGKWHLGTRADFHPTKLGFGYFMGFLGGGIALKDPVLERDGQPTPFQGFTCDLLTDHAIRFLEKHRRGPFCLCVHYRDPHAPWKPLPEEDGAVYAGLDPLVPNPDFPKLDIPRVKKLTAEYFGSIASVDRGVGRILRTLDELKLANNTVVIFTSDNGYNVGHHGVLHKGNGSWILTEPPPGTANVRKGFRPNMFDNSLRIPTAIRWPGVIRAGRVITETISNLDWYPTLLAMAGADVPKGETIRGRNFLPMLKGRTIPGWSNDLYAEYSVHNTMRADMRMFRTPHWKLVRNFLEPQRDELYDLKNDPDEMRNLIRDGRPEVRAVIAQLHAKILGRMREVGDPVLKTVLP